MSLQSEKEPVHQREEEKKYTNGGLIGAPYTAQLEGREARRLCSVLTPNRFPGQALAVHPSFLRVTGRTRRCSTSYTSGYSAMLQPNTEIAGKQGRDAPDAGSGSAAATKSDVLGAITRSGNLYVLSIS